MRKELEGFSEELEKMDKDLEYLKLTELYKEKAEAEADWMMGRFSRINFNTPN